MKIGLLGIAGKPITVGHWMLIEKASSENSKVNLFVSSKDREIISGQKMAEVWDKFLIKHLPKNIVFNFVNNPIKEIYSSIRTDGNLYQVYSDPEDIEKNFPQKSIDKYFSSCQVNLVPVSRDSLVKISATEMRSYLSDNDKSNFCKFLPNCLNEEDKDSIWNLLHEAKAEKNLKALIGKLI